MQVRGYLLSFCSIFICHLKKFKGVCVKGFGGKTQTSANGQLACISIQLSQLYLLYLHFVLFVMVLRFGASFQGKPTRWLPPRAMES